MGSVYHRQASAYEDWLSTQGIPVFTDYGLEDVRNLDLASWALLGGRGAAVKVHGMEGLTGMFVLELPPGAETPSVRHLFEKITYVLDGQVEITAADPRQGDKVESLLLGSGDLVAPPLNIPHSFRNPSGSEATLLLFFSNAPIVMDIFQDPDFIFESDHVFRDRLPPEGQSLFFTGATKLHEPEEIWLCDCSVLENVPELEVGKEEKKGAGVKLAQFEFSRGILVTHIADWPAGSYQKAHYHGGGATLLIIKGHGYTLMWPQEAGLRPYETGNESQIVRVDWQVGSAFTPPDGWFHQHFNVSDKPARQLAFRYGSRRRGVEFQDLRKGAGVYKSVREGGTLIEYEDEDPAIRRMFEAATDRER